MAIIVDVKGQGKVEFPDGMSKSQILDVLRGKFSSEANKYIGAGEALGTIGSSIVAEPVSGLAGIAGALLPGEEGQGARWVKSTQDALTYQPKTEMGQKTIGAIGETLAPIGEIIDGASKKLGDKAYAATGSPALAAAAYSAPTALMEGLGVKGFNIARKPISKENLFAIRSGFGMVDEAKPITSIHELFDYTPQQLSEQLKRSNPSSVVDGVYREQKRAFYTDYMPDGSITMFKNDGTPLKTMTPEEAKRIYRDKILEIELQKPEAQKIIAEREAKSVEYEQTQADNDYRMAHKAPRRDSNPTLDDLSTVFDDIYGDRAYQLNAAGLPFDRKAIDIIRSMKGNPDKEITIYRALPKGVKDINAGDWVATTKEYAEQHAKYDPSYVVISKKVKVKDIVTDGNSIHEFGYDPSE